MTLEAIDKVAFINAVNIRAMNIDGYFKRFKSRTLTVYPGRFTVEEEKTFKNEVILKNFEKLEKEYIDFIKQCYTFNKGKLIIDFYINRLDDGAISKILKVLDKNEQGDFLKLIENLDKEKIYFKVVNEEILDIIVKLNTRNMFFTTFYFLENELTLWGNYDLKFPMFFKDYEILKGYEEIAKMSNLNILKN